jgi:hypothetical protein
VCWRTYLDEFGQARRRLLGLGRALKVELVLSLFHALAPRDFFYGGLALFALDELLFVQLARFGVALQLDDALTRGQFFGRGGAAEFALGAKLALDPGSRGLPSAAAAAAVHAVIAAIMILIREEDVCGLLLLVLLVVMVALAQLDGRERGKGQGAAPVGGLLEDGAAPRLECVEIGVGRGLHGAGALLLLHGKRRDLDAARNGPIVRLLHARQRAPLLFLPDGRDALELKRVPQGRTARALISVGRGGVAFAAVYVPRGHGGRDITRSWCLLTFFNKNSVVVAVWCREGGGGKEGGGGWQR